MMKACGIPIFLLSFCPLNNIYFEYCIFDLFPWFNLSVLFEEDTTYNLVQFYVCINSLSNHGIKLV